MRSKNATKNLISYFVYEILLFVLGIVFPRFIIATYGSEVNGLTSTISRLLSVINLIQAGAVGAAIFQMFKPVADDDYETQSSIIYTSRKFYNKITIIYLVLSVALGIGYGFYLKGNGFGFVEIFFSFVILGLSGSFSLFLTSICDIYISPHQKSYYLKISSIFNLFVHYGLLTLVLVTRAHFIFIYVSILFGSLANAGLNYFFYRKLSKGKISRNPANKNFVIPNRKYLMLSSIANEGITASPAIIITSFVDLSSTSVFSIYSMIFVSMKTILLSIQYSVSPIFGNVVKTSDDKKILEVYSGIELLTLMLGSFVSMCVGFLIIPFIFCYTKGISDINYNYPVLSFFAITYLVIVSFKCSFEYVSVVYGLFKQVSISKVVFAILGIIVSIVSVVLFGFPFVMVGLILYEVGTSICLLFIMKKSIPWFKIGSLFRRTIFMSLSTAFSTILYLVVRPEINSLVIWVVYGLIVAAISIIVVGVYCLLFERKQAKLIFQYVHLFFSKKKKNVSHVD